MASQISNYAKRMARLSARIFGEVARPTNQKSMRVVKMFSEKPVEQRQELVHYYPNHVNITSLMKRVRFLGLFRDEHQDFKDEIKRIRALRGKVKPKKGEGKRAMKRK